MTKNKTILLIILLIISIPILVYAISKLSNSSEKKLDDTPKTIGVDVSETLDSSGVETSTNPSQTTIGFATSDTSNSYVTTIATTIESMNQSQSEKTVTNQSTTEAKTSTNNSTKEPSGTTSTTKGEITTTTTKTNNDITVKPEVLNRKIAVNFVSKLKLGWNLGNTLDSTDSEDNRWLKGKLPTEYEQAWNNPVTTKAMIDKVKKSGFNTIRIPITWDRHIGSGSDYKIDEKWIKRVKEVVDYAIDDNTYVIINLHHEDWLITTEANYKENSTKYKKVWAQIAEKFKYYSDHLIFEGMNEPRLYGSTVEWTGNPESYRVVNKFNSDFVATIRNSGEKNLTRFLMIPTYAASSDLKIINALEVPEDSRIIISLHAYTPYHFALNNNPSDRWYKRTWIVSQKSDTQEIDELMIRIKNRFIDKGIPVILGEFGALNKNNINDRVEWAKYYVKSARSHGIPPIWWDNGSFSGSGENFGLLNRAKLVWAFPEIVDAMNSALK